MSQLSQEVRPRSQLPVSAGALVKLLALALALMPWMALGAAAGLLGQQAPDFALRSIDNQNVRLSEHQGEVIVINFWVSWCGQCREQMQQLDELYAKYRRAGLVLLSVNIDTSAARAAEMARTLKVSYPVLIDARKEVSKSYQVEAMPLTVLIDRAGVVRYIVEGYRAGDEKRYAEQLRELLNE
jgi:peroxiredoxin